MKITLQKKIGETTFIFTIENENDFKALFFAGGLASAPIKCGKCQSENIHLTSNKAKEYTYVKIKCRDCDATNTLGQYKDGDGFYWRGWEEKYVPNITNNPPNTNY